MSFFNESKPENKLASSFIGCIVSTMYIDGVATDAEIQNMTTAYFGRSLFDGVDYTALVTQQIMRTAEESAEDILKDSCKGLTEEWKPTVFAICADLIFKDHIITPEEREFLKKMRDYMGLRYDIAENIMDVIGYLYKGRL